MHEMNCDKAWELDVVDELLTHAKKRQKYCTVHCICTTVPYLNERSNCCIKKQIN